MFAYHIPGASALDMPRCVPQRLRQFGPWAAADYGGGVWLTLQGHELTPAQAQEAGYVAEATPEGWTFSASPDLDLDALLRPRINRDACQVVPLANGSALVIRPAYLEPRHLFTDGRIGDPATEYGRQARVVRDRLASSTGDAPVVVADPQVLGLIAQAIGITYRAPPEVINRSGVLTTDDVEPLLLAVLTGPKPQPGADTSPSPSPG